MSRMATKPSAACTWSPSGHEAAEEAVILRQRRAPPPPETPTAPRASHRPPPSRRGATACSRRRSRDPGRSTRTTSLRADPTAPTGAARIVGCCAEPRAAFLLDLAGAPGSSPAVRVPGRGEYGKTCTLVMPRSATTSIVRAKADVVLGREADDHVGREIEVAERLDARTVLRDRVTPSHRAQHSVVTRLERNVQMARDDRRLAQ